MSRLFTLLRTEARRIVPAGYSLADLSADMTSGLTVAVVALPLGLVVAIAAGASPDKGLVGIIVGGAVIAVFTASRFQIGGPTEACILIAVIVIERFGYDGLMSATLLAGLFLVAMAISKVGILIESMPQAVITGFVTGMGVIIFTGQIVPFFGMASTVHAHDHGGADHSHSFLFIMNGVLERLGNFDPVTAAVGVGSLLAVLLTKRFLPNLPSYVMGLGVGALATGLLRLEVATIGNTFGELPNRLPRPYLPSLELWVDLAPYAVAIAFLSSAESLLAASMASRSRGVPNRPNREFTALGVGNIAASIWGGFPVGGCVARTATCLSSGARTPLAGVFHALIVAIFVFFFSWAMEYIPLASLSAVLLVVAARMVEVDRVRAIARAPIGDRLTLVATLATTLFWDLRYVIPVGLVLAAIIFIQRISNIFIVRRGDTALFDSQEMMEMAPLPPESPPGVEIISFRGPLFYGTVNSLSDLLARGARQRPSCVFGMRNVYFMDPTACLQLQDLSDRLVRTGTICYFWGIQPEVAEVMHQMNFLPKEGIVFFPDAGSAVEAATRHAAGVIEAEGGAEATAPAPA